MYGLERVPIQLFIDCCVLFTYAGRLAYIIAVVFPVGFGGQQIVRQFLTKRMSLKTTATTNKTAATARRAVFGVMLSDGPLAIVERVVVPLRGHHHRFLRRR